MGEPPMRSIPDNGGSRCGLHGSPPRPHRLGATSRTRVLRLPPTVGSLCNRGTVLLSVSAFVRSIIIAQKKAIVNTKSFNFFKTFFENLLTNAAGFGIISRSDDSDAGMAQSVEHVIGNDEVISSILITSSKKAVAIAAAFLSVYSLFPFSNRSRRRRTLGRLAR